MIESGLSNFALGNAAIQALLGQSAADKTAGVYSAFYFSVLPKGAALPGIVLDRLKSDDAADTLDLRTPAPGTMIEARFQFGSVAQDQEGSQNPNPASPSGYLSAAFLSQALRRQLIALPSAGALPDGTLVKDVWIIDEYDAHYESGGQGYIFRRVLQIGMLFQETR